MRQLLAFPLFLFPSFSLAELVIDDPSSALEFAFDAEIPENTDMFSPLSWEDLNFSIPSLEDPQQILDFEEASVLSTPFLVTDSNPDTLQSQYGPESNWASGKLRARNGEQCKN